MAHHKAKEPNSQAGAQDMRKTPGKGTKPPAMGMKRKLGGRQENRKARSK